jgi:hypothetical protein
MADNCAWPNLEHEACHKSRARVANCHCGKIVWNAESKVALTAPPFGGHMLDRRGHLYYGSKCHGMHACAAADAESQEREKPTEPQ